MSPFTVPLRTAFELQRTAIEQSQRLLETGLAFQVGVNETVVNGIESQEDVQRRMLALQHVAVHRLCDRVDERVPGASTDEVRSVVDDQFSRLYDDHEELYENLVGELEERAEAYDDVSGEYFDALTEQTELLVQASEELETHSVETAEQLEEPVETLQEQLTTLQDQLDGAGHFDALEESTQERRQ